MNQFTRFLSHNGLWPSPKLRIRKAYKAYGDYSEITTGETKVPRLGSDGASILVTGSLALLFLAELFPPLFLIAMGALIISGMVGGYHSIKRWLVLGRKMKSNEEIELINDEEKKRLAYINNSKFSVERLRHLSKFLFIEMMGVSVAGLLLAKGLSLYFSGSLVGGIGLQFIVNTTLITSGVGVLGCLLVTGWNIYKYWQASKACDEYNGVDQNEIKRLRAHRDERATKLKLSAFILVGTAICFGLAFLPFTWTLVLAGVLFAVGTAVVMTYYWKKNYNNLQRNLLIEKATDISQRKGANKDLLNTAIKMVIDCTDEVKKDYNNPEWYTHVYSRIGSNQDPEAIKRLNRAITRLHYVTNNELVSHATELGISSIHRNAVTTANGYVKTTKDILDNTPGWDIFKQVALRIELFFMERTLKNAVDDLTEQVNTFNDEQIYTLPGASDAVASSGLVADHPPEPQADATAPAPAASHTANSSDLVTDSQPQPQVATTTPPTPAATLKRSASTSNLFLVQGPDYKGATTGKETTVTVKAGPVTITTKDGSTVIRTSEGVVITVESSARNPTQKSEQKTAKDGNPAIPTIPPFRPKHT